MATKGNKQINTSGEINLWQLLTHNRLNLLLILFPLALMLEYLHRRELIGNAQLWIFISSALAIVPLAGLIGEATEELAERVGPALGGFFNATFGNATELIIALFALHAGLFEVVKASISGSIIGNILLVLGASMYVGGMGREKQRFNRTHAGAGATMLLLAVVALVMPALFDMVTYHTLDVMLAPPDIKLLSLLVAIVLLLIYGASLIFSLKTHRMLIAVSDPSEDEVTGNNISKQNALILLIIATTLTAFMAELLVGSISVATKSLHMTEFFVGVVVVAIIGNAAEHFSAVVMARKNKMELAVTISTASSTQIALFVAPVLVLASFFFGNPMSLIFNVYEIFGIALSVLVLSVVSLDGESNWFEGLQLMAVYLLLVIVFFFVRPTTAVEKNPGGITMPASYLQETGK